MYYINNKKHSKFQFLKLNIASNCTNLMLTDLLLSACTGAGFGDWHTRTNSHPFCVRARRGSKRAQRGKDGPRWLWCD